MLILHFLGAIVYVHTYSSVGVVRIVSSYSEKGRPNYFTNESVKNLSMAAALVFQLGGGSCSARMAACSLRWCDVEDSSSDDGQPLLQRNSFPFYLFLRSFLDGLFNARVSLESMEGLQWYLCRDGRLATLPPGLQDLLLHLLFGRGQFRKQVRAFLWTLQHGGVSWDAVRKWQAWLRLQCWYDPPIYCRHAYAAIYVLQM